MTYTTLCENIIKENLDNINNIQIEFKNQDIIITHTLLDEMYNELNISCGYNEQDIITKISSIDKSIHPYYDSTICYFKVCIKDILDNNYNLKLVSDELQDKYKKVAYTMLELMKEKKMNIKK